MLYSFSNNFIISNEYIEPGFQCHKKPQKMYLEMDNYARNNAVKNYYKKCY